MTIYYIIIIYSFLNGVLYDKVDSNIRRIINFQFISIFILIIGFRYHVGVDWFNYFNVYERSIVDPFSITTSEFLYKLINVFCYFTDLGMVGIIFICTVLFIFFTIKGIEHLNINPYYFFVIISPYHFIMSGLNYTRQGVALSIMIYAFAALYHKGKKIFILMTILAGGFHSSAYVFLLFAFIDFNLFIVFFFAIIFIPVITMLSIERYNQYLSGEMDSAGLWLRAVYLLVPALFSILNYPLWKVENSLIRRFYFIVIISFPIILSLSIASTTIADRFSYYLIVFSTMMMLKLNTVIPNNRGILYKSAPIMMFTASMTAMIIWSIYSKYIFSYYFDSYLIHVFGL